jgi:itaconate CoA-transferase
LRAVRPELIHCIVSGSGPDGPYSSKKAYDLLMQCETGLLSVTGTAAEPVKAGTSVADIAAGMYAYSGILTALLQRYRSGDGATLEIAMIDALGDWMTQPALLSASLAGPPRRTGAHHASIAPYGPYPCRNGTVFLAIQNDREWATLCRDLLGQPELAGDSRFVHNPDRVEHRQDLDQILTRACAGRDCDEVESLLEESGIATGRLRTAGELLTHPQLVARKRWSEVQIPGGGTAPALLPPVIFVGSPTSSLGEVPELGQHSQAIRAELALVPRRAGNTP